MPKISMSKAAKLAGRSRTTLYKHIENGKVSAEKDADGHWAFDVAELERVYGPLKRVDVQGNSKVDTPERSGNASGEHRIALLEQEVSFKDEQIRSLKDQLEETKTEKHDLLDVVKAQTRLLQAGKEDQKPARRWWRFGRSA